MKKYILSLVAALSLAVAPVYAQEEAAAPGTPAVENAVIVVSQDDDIVVLQSGDELLEVEADTYNDLKDNKKFSDAKIFKDVKIDKADGDGIGVTLMAMCIVLLALIVLSILFMIFGKFFAKKHKEKRNLANANEPVVVDDDDHTSGEVIAAIAMALDEHFNSKHDLEDTVLTIRRMKRAYSPWSSKIYNLREFPQVKHNRR